jgi:hypothetical protein
MPQSTLRTYKILNCKAVLLSIVVTAAFLLAPLLPLSESQAQAAGPELVLQSSRNTVYTNQTFTITASLAATGTAHSNTTLQLTYDPDLVEALQVNQGSLYYTYNNQNIDATNGIVTISGNFFGNTLVQSGTLATVEFRAKTTGTAQISSADSSIYYNSDQLYVSSYPTTSVTINPPEADAVLTLSSDFSSWVLNDSQWISLVVDSQGNQVAGVDAILLYDPTKMQYSNYSWSGLFPYQPTFSVDPDAGRIYISGVTTEGNPMNTVAEMLRVEFTTIALGETAFSFDWTAGSTTDTNIASYTAINTDLLAVAPTPLTITTITGATLNFSFELKDFLGDISSVSGTLAVDTQTPRSFSNPIASGSTGQISSFFLGTLLFDSSHDLIIRVPGYLRKKQTAVITVGANPLSGYLQYGQLTPGDINGDNVINSFDLSNLFNSWNNTYVSKVAEDLNGDNKVNTFDAAILYSYFNQTAALD